MWKKIRIHETNIKYQTAKAAMIFLPKRTSYKGWFYWHPLKLITNKMELLYTEEFKFNLKRKVYDKYEEKQIDSKEFENIYAKRNSNFEFAKDKVYIEEPTPLKINVEVPDELKR